MTSTARTAPTVDNAGGVASLDQRVSVSSIKDSGLGMGEKADFVTIKGSITFIRHDTDPWYAACPNGDCNKKVCVWAFLPIYIHVYIYALGACFDDECLDIYI